MTTRLRPSRTRLLKIYQRLLAAHGHLNWWPGDTPFDVMVGAILTQNTSWKNVEQAIANLKAANLLDPHALLKASKRTMHRALRPSGYFRLKTVRLLSFVKYYVETHGADRERMRARPLPELREELLSVHGVGEETADSILLYALEKPIFVVDAYTRRIFHRLGFLGTEPTYGETQALFHSALPPDVPLYNDYHAQIVRLGNTVCRPTPKCERCPLRGAPCPGNIRIAGAI